MEVERIQISSWAIITDIPAVDVYILDFNVTPAVVSHTPVFPSLGKLMATPVFASMCHTHYDRIKHVSHWHSLQITVTGTKIFSMCRYISPEASSCTFDLLIVRSESSPAATMVYTPHLTARD